MKFMYTYRDTSAAAAQRRSSLALSHSRSGVMREGTPNLQAPLSPGETNGAMAPAVGEGRVVWL